LLTTDSQHAYLKAVNNAFEDDIMLCFKKFMVVAKDAIPPAMQAVLIKRLMSMEDITNLV
jgi:hypothetical protein